MRCPVCGALAPMAESITRDLVGGQRIFIIHHCRACDARFDQRVETVDETKNEELQARAGADVYQRPLNDKEYEHLLAINRTMIRGFERFFRLRHVYVEIGVGLGMLTRAASGLFEQSYGLDLEVETAKRSGNVPTGVQFIRHHEFLHNLRCEISALCAWHVIEHLPNPKHVIEPLIALMPEDAVSLGQIPLFKAEHVCDAHYIFYSERTLVALFESCGLTPVLLERDETNDFLTYCFRKKVA